MAMEQSQARRRRCGAPPFSLAETEGATGEMYVITETAQVPRVSGTISIKTWQRHLRHSFPDAKKYWRDACLLRVRHHIRGESG
jgi:hypothetical protein